MPDAQHRTRRRALLSWFDRHQLALAVAVAFANRVYYMIDRRTWDLPPTLDKFFFGFESGRIARAIASGRGFSDPFIDPSGPTAWLAPLYPAITALAFKIFGVYTHSAMIAMFLFNAACAALTCVPMYYIGRRVVGEGPTRVAVWLWAVLWLFARWPVSWVWETSLSTLLVTTLVWLTYEWRNTARWTHALAFGLVTGTIALCNPSLLIFVPFAMAYVYVPPSRSHQPGARLPGHECEPRVRISRTQAIAVVGVIVLMITPWTIRNYRVFGRVIPVRDSAGAELRLGNGPGANGTWMEWLHPTQNDTEFEKFVQLGELRYIDQRQHEAVAFIKEDPLRFVRLSLARFVYFWMGPPAASTTAASGGIRRHDVLLVSILAFVGLWRVIADRRSGWQPLAILLGVYPLVYYVVYPNVRYRHPIEPVLALLSAYAVYSAAQNSLHTWRTKTKTAQEEQPAPLIPTR